MSAVHASQVVALPMAGPLNAAIPAQPGIRFSECVTVRLGIARFDGQWTGDLSLTVGRRSLGGCRELDNACRDRG